MPNATATPTPAVHSSESTSRHRGSKVTITIASAAHSETTSRDSKEPVLKEEVVEELVEEEDGHTQEPTGNVSWQCMHTKRICLLQSQNKQQMEPVLKQQQDTGHPNKMMLSGRV